MTLASSPSASTVTASPSGVRRLDRHVAGRETGTTTEAAPRERQPSSKISSSSERRDEAWVDERAHRLLVVRLVDEHAAENADLGSGEADAPRLLHQPRHPLDEIGDGLVDLVHLARPNPQRRVGILADLRERGSTPGFPLGVELLAANLAFNLTHEGEKSIKLDRSRRPAGPEKRPVDGQKEHRSGDGAEPGAMSKNSSIGSPKPSALTMKLPIRAPTIPSSVVMMMPPGSSPGSRALAMRPASRPRMIHAMIPMQSSVA